MIWNFNKEAISVTQQPGKQWSRHFLLKLGHHLYMTVFGYREYYYPPGTQPILQLSEHLWTLIQSEKLGKSPGLYERTQTCLKRRFQNEIKTNWRTLIKKHMLCSFLCWNASQFGVHPKSFTFPPCHRNNPLKIITYLSVCMHTHTVQICKHVCIIFVCAHTHMVQICKRVIACVCVSNDNS